MQSASYLSRDEGETAGDTDKKRFPRRLLRCYFAAALLRRCPRWRVKHWPFSALASLFAAAVASAHPLPRYQSSQRRSLRDGRDGFRGGDRMKMKR